MPSTSIFHTWGSTADERARAYPCDEHVAAGAAAYFRAVDVTASASVVFRWLCQLRVAPYSYDWIDNLGRRSPRALTPGLEQLERGQRFMTIFHLADFEPGRHVTLVMDRGNFVFGDVAATYEVVPADAARSRLRVKLVVRYPRWLLGWVVRRFLPLGDFIMMRKQLLTLKRLAEQTNRQPAP
jgi:hypothetical protein